MRWHDFAEQATELAARGWDLLAESHGYAFLATIAPDGSPRVNPVAPIRSDQGLFVAIMNTSPKLADVRRDPRIALHASVAAPDDEEFSLRGQLNEVPDPEARKAAVAGARDGAELSDSVTLFEVDLHHASWALWTTRPPPPGPSGPPAPRAEPTGAPTDPPPRPNPRARTGTSRAGARNPRARARNSLAGTRISRAGARNLPGGCA